MPESKIFEVPQLYRDVAIVSSNPGLAASISTALGNDGEYVVVLESPREWPVLSHVWDLDLAFICNTLYRVRPQMLLLLQVTDKSASAFRAKFTNIPVSTVMTLDEALRLLQGKTRPLSGVMRCRFCEVATGLLLAKRRSSLLLIDETSPSLDEDTSAESERDHLIALDDIEGMAPIIAANFAFSANADLTLLPPRDDDFQKEAYMHIDSRSAYRGVERGLRAEVALNQIEVDLRPHLNLGNRKFVTFMTRGFPYGYFWHVAPSTHIFTRGSDRYIASAICWNDNSLGSLSAVFVDPGDFPNSEVAELGKKVETWGTAATLLEGPRATVNNVRLYLSAFPSDLFYICSHCGAVNGERLEIRVPCHDGNEHIFSVDTVLNIHSDIREINGTESVLLTEFFMPMSMDGTEWPDVESKFKEDWSRCLEGKYEVLDNVVSRTPIGIIHNTTAIGLTNGHFILISFRAFDPSVFPIFFNNACVSFFAASSHLMALGARAYVGTLAPVANDSARQFALDVFNDGDAFMSLPLAIYNAQRQLWADPADRIYVHVGCHFVRFVQRAPSQLKNAQLRRISLSRQRWKDYLKQPDVPGRDLVNEYIEFLSECEAREGERFS